MFRSGLVARLRRALPIVVLAAGFGLPEPAAARNTSPIPAPDDPDVAFSPDNSATNPQGVITDRRGQGKFSTAEIATLTFTRQSVPPAAPTISAVHPGDEALTVVWEAPSGVSDITAYDVRYILTSADETVDSNWTVEEDIWAGEERHHVVAGLTNDSGHDVQVRAVTDMDGSWSATVAGTPAEPGDSLATSVDLPLEVPLGASIGIPRDVDFFSFTVRRTTFVSLFTRGAVDTNGTLYDGNGNYTGYNDDEVELEELNFLIEAILDPGTYYLEVRAFFLGTGSYTVHAETIPDTTGIDDAQAVAVDAVHRGVFEEGGDEDYFQFTLLEETDLVIRSGPPITDMVGELLDSDGASITVNDDGFVLGTSLQFLMRRKLGAGAYYVKVKAFSEEETGQYSLHVETVTEPGSAIADAAALDFEQLAVGRIDPSTDADFFRIDLSAATHVLARAVSNTVDIDGALLDGNGDPVEANVFEHTFTADGPIGFTLSDRLEAGTHYVKVTRSGGDSTGGYAIRMLEDEDMNEVVARCSALTAPFSDPLSGCQWNLKNTGQFGGRSGEDIQVEDVWAGGNMGAGIGVAVVDGGLDEVHPDLRENVDAARGHDYTDGDGLLDHGGFHGTGVAGLIAARDNELGGRGVAPRATVYGYNLVRSSSDLNEADAMTRNMAATAVSNNSWGPPDGPGLDPAPAVWEMAVDDGVETGYGGKGIVYLWAGGNGGLVDDDSNFDEYANYYGVVAVCAVTDRGRRSGYSERGANLWICAPSSGGYASVFTTYNYGRYSADFGGTSAAAPTVAGVVALVRAANPALTWRDVKLILAASARKNHRSSSGWRTGASTYGASGRYHFNHEYGFGVVHAKAAVGLADGWANVPPFIETDPAETAPGLVIPDATFTPGATVTSAVEIGTEVEFIEFVEVIADFDAAAFRDLRVELVSPSNTVSTLARPSRSTRGIDSDFRFGSARHLGEDPAGTWTLRITDHLAADKATLRSWSLKIYGHRSTPGAPAVPVATPGQRALTLLWTAPSTVGAAEVTSYDVRYIPSDATDKADNRWTDERDVWTSGALSHTVTGLQDGLAYDVQVRGVNAKGRGAWSASATATTLPNAAPEFNSSPAFDAAENQRSVDTVRASDSDAEDSVTGYAIVGGADARFFSIGPASGVLTFDSTPNFEDTQDANGDGRYLVAVQATSGTGVREKTATQSIWVTVTDVGGEKPAAPAAPMVSPASVTSLTVAWSAPDNDGPAITDYDVQYRAGTSGGWTDPGHNGTAITATLTGLAEGTSYQAQVRATNDEGTGDWSASGTGSTNTNAAPAFDSSAYLRANENQTSVDTVRASDSDTEDDVTDYAIAGGADQGQFSIDSGSGVLTFNAAPNFEAPSDTNADGSYLVTVQATSGMGTREKTAEQSITVTVTDVSGELPSAPAAPAVSAASLTSLNVSWSAPANAGPAVTDYDYRHRTASPTGNWTEITTTTITGLATTIGSLAEDTSYDVQVRATNADGTGDWSASGSGSTDANAAPAFDSSATFRPDENQTTAGTVVASDSDMEDDIEGYAIAGGADRGLFSIDSGSGVLTFDAAPNYEDPEDAGTDGNYQVTVEATSGTGAREKTATRPITVTVADVGGEKPAAPSALSVSSASVTSLNVTWSAPENAGPAITDYDYRYRTASPAGNWTEITNTTITGLSATIGSLAENTSYDVQVRAANADGESDWSASGTGSTDANAAPAFDSSAYLRANENQTSVDTVRASDSDTEDDVTDYAIAGGADQGQFSIDSGSGVLTFNAAPNFEAPSDTNADGSYLVTVQATSGMGTREKTAEQSITVTVTDVSGELPSAPAAPAVSAASLTSLNVSWSAPANAGPAVTDYDYRHRTASPAGNWTEITTTTITGLATTIGSLAEDTSYDVQVRATNADGTGDWSASGSGSTDANAAPAFDSSATFRPDENQTTAGTVVASDSDMEDDIEGYAITGGADRGLFSIDSGSGVLTFDAAPNYEDPEDAGTDGNYQVTVEATSGTGAREKMATRPITVTVADVGGEKPAAPSALSVSSASVTSLNVTWSAPGNAGPAITDYDYRYRTASPAGNWTEITNTTITGLSATIGSLAENTSYDVQVRATNDEGTGDWSASGTGSTDANAAPAFDSSAYLRANENQTSVDTVRASDSDTEDDVTDYAIAGGADRGKFSIHSTLGVLSFTAAPNYEDPKDADTDGGYVVEVQATSGTGARVKTATQTITVAVTDVDGERPAAPLAPSVSPASASSLSVSWSAPDNAGPAITDYDVRHRPAGSGTWVEGAHDGAGTTATIRGLAAATTYRVQVRATSDEGTGDWSASGSGATDDDGGSTGDTSGSGSGSGGSGSGGSGSGGSGSGGSGGGSGGSRDRPPVVTEEIGVAGAGAGRQRDAGRVATLPRPGAARADVHGGVGGPRGGDGDGRRRGGDHRGRRARPHAGDADGDGPAPAAGDAGVRGARRTDGVVRGCAGVGAGGRHGGADGDHRPGAGRAGDAVLCGGRRCRPGDGGRGRGGPRRPGRHGDAGGRRDGGVARHRGLRRRGHRGAARDVRGDAAAHGGTGGTVRSGRGDGAGDDHGGGVRPHRAGAQYAAPLAAVRGGVGGGPGGAARSGPGGAGPRGAARPRPVGADRTARAGPVGEPADGTAGGRVRGAWPTGRTAVAGQPRRTVRADRAARARGRGRVRAGPGAGAGAAGGGRAAGRARGGGGDARDAVLRCGALGRGCARERTADGDGRRHGRRAADGHGAGAAGHALRAAGAVPVLPGRDADGGRPAGAVQGAAARDGQTAARGARHRRRRAAHRPGRAVRGVGRRRADLRGALERPGAGGGARHRRRPDRRLDPGRRGGHGDGDGDGDGRRRAVGDTDVRSDRRTDAGRPPARLAPGAADPPRTGRARLMPGTGHHKGVWDGTPQGCLGRDTTRVSPTRSARAMAAPSGHVRLRIDRRGDPGGRPGMCMHSKRDATRAATSGAATRCGECSSAAVGCTC